MKDHKGETMFHRLAHVLALSLFLGAATFICPGSGGSLSAKEPEIKPQRELRDIYERLLKAARQKDEKTLRDILTEDYTQVTADGRIRSKEARISETLQSTDELSTLTLEDFKLRVYSGAAIALCRVSQEGISNGKPFKSTILSTVTFIREGGRWRIAATHLTFNKD
jgi:ketosteroid isomerase-like protein